MSGCKTVRLDGTTHYSRNKQWYIDRAANRRIELKAFIDNLKINKPCLDCGNTFPPVCMDYDHLPGKKKEISIGQAWSNGWSIKRILSEIDKCELVCANCHRIRTQKRYILLAQ